MTRYDTAVKEIQKLEKGGTKLKKKRDYVGYLMYFLKILVPKNRSRFILRGFFLIPVRVDGHSMQKLESRRYDCDGKILRH